MNAASIAVLLVTDNYLNSEYVREKEIPILLQRRATDGLRVIPILVKPCDWKAVDWLRKMNLRPDPKRPISAGNEHQIDSDFAAIAKEIRELLKRTAPPVERSFVPLNPNEISIARLPVTGPDLFGRDVELKLLDDAWANPATNVVTFVAWGGVGKTALVNHWVRRLAARNYEGAERVYAWSFYSQGTSEDRAATAEYFINDALGWFGDPDPIAGSPWDKGERLARLIRAQRTLLVLDGLEPLQQPPNELGLIEGRLKEQSMQALLRELAAGQPGLCVISTRVAVTELDDYESAALRCDLDQLAPEAGAQLLRKLGVTGEGNELQQAAAEFGGHSLALTLLGGYLNEVFGGDVRRRREIEVLTADAKHGGHARRVMASYEKWLGEGPELAVLRLLGLFDRPADGASIAALRTAPAIPGLTDVLQPLSEAQWRQTLAKLRRIRLLAERPAQAPRESEEELDAHPLVREHFRDRLKAERSDAWCVAHNRLYEHLTRTTPNLPDTLAGLAPLFAAAAHGCKAGRHQEVRDEVYWSRILRGEAFYTARTLGAFDAELTLLTNFFELPWDKPVDELRQSSIAFIFRRVGLCLHALGQLEKALKPMQSALDLRLSLGQWNWAATNAGHLSEIYKAKGDLQMALAYASQGVELADRSNDVAQQVARRGELAHVLHQLGGLSLSASIFDEAEKLQQGDLPHRPFHRYLYTILGFCYCDLLLDQGKYKEVQIRSDHILNVANWKKWPRDIALSYLSLGRAKLVQFRQECIGNYAEVDDLLTRAIGMLQQKNHQDLLPLALIVRVEMYRVTGDYALGRANLDEALRIATRGSMRLHLADCHLESARLALATGDRDTARKAWETAQKMIEEMGYHRRDGEVAEIEQELNAG